MPDFKINEQCVIGMPSCGYGFGSSRMCFIARPADGEFQLEEDILRQLLKDRNYDWYVALQKIDPGNFAFCTKICSKIITAQFTIALLNNSSNGLNPSVKMPNPNVHMEYGLMLGFHKHIIPMQRDTEALAFNIAPLDTIKYRPENFKEKAASAIDNAISRFTTQEPSGSAAQPAPDIVKYMALKGLRLSDVTLPDNRAVFSLGSGQQFNLFDSFEKVIFWGNFDKEDPREIVMRTRFLLNNINDGYRNVKSQSNANMLLLTALWSRIQIELLVPENADAARMAAKIDEFQGKEIRPPVTIRKPSEITAIVQLEYDKLVL